MAQNNELEKTLWAAADKLRNNMEVICLLQLVIVLNVDVLFIRVFNGMAYVRHHLTIRVSVIKTKQVE